MRQARYWICTIPRDSWTPELPNGAAWCIGQPERGESGYLHWQVLVSFPSKKTIAQVKAAFGLQGMHVEATRSSAAEAYVHKEETRDGDPFEFGSRAVNRNNAADWDRVKELAQAGNLDLVPADIYIRYYRTLTAIASDYEVPVGIEKNVFVFYGRTGTGKSRRAWEEAGPGAYSKDPRSKFWCGYRSDEHVVIDEFRGGIDISHLLRWLDRYPVRVEIKGGSRPLKATKIWITSNLHPMNWYIDLDQETKNALIRRLQITEFQ
ncbi:putative Rep protein [Circovirus-like genome DCCV-8]|uniref:Replication-associated protein n=1 Tax=Circovirus-like genome DCCV-8 TaxID=1788448 RepID=A0A190WHK4_9VIRU|nr:putative Rep protein [Circovirus-like genome DCCV-8]AMB42975.1 putative Rep protein [Circovirus-like genome DCCV-8]